jgi:hypothetical protein
VATKAMIASFRVCMLMVIGLLPQAWRLRCLLTPLCNALINAVN